MRNRSTVEFRCVEAAPLANGRKRRAAIDVCIDGSSLADASDGAPLDREVVQATPQSRWFEAGDIALLTCGCGDVGCADYRARVRRDGDIVIWTLWDGREVAFDPAATLRSLRSALDA